jgi:hypothetical protein
VHTELVGVLEQLQERTVLQEEVILHTIVQHQGLEIIDLERLLEQQRLEHLPTVIQEVALAADGVTTLAVAVAPEAVETIEVRAAAALEAVAA